MRILWVISQVLPEMAEYLGISSSNFGGWVRSMLTELKKKDEISLGVVSCSVGLKKIESFEKEGVRYWILPLSGKNRDVSTDDCAQVVGRFSPDLIHIEGTEWSVSKRFAELKGVPNLVSMQGILNGYEPYQYGDIPVADYIFSLSWHKIVTGWSLFLRKRFLFDKRLEIERDTIAAADHIMGRTLWDRAHSYCFNRKADYYSCNRTLRKSFYENEWQYASCKKHSVFVGNGYSALKGGHTVLEAVRLLAEEYPDVSLAFAGEDPFIHKKTDFKKRIGYSYYLRWLIKDPVLKSRVQYLGTMNEQQMVMSLLQANVYVLPSLIENSPNTLGEAMIMGVPCVSAYTGGSGEMAIDEKEALLFRAGDAAMLAWQIKRVFDREDSVREMCSQAQKHARITHDPQKNVNDLVYAYHQICEKDGKK